MPYYYATEQQQNTNGSASTDTVLENWHTVAATNRAYMQKLLAGSFATPADNAIRLRFERITTIGSYAAGTADVPSPLIPDAPAANVVADHGDTTTSAVFGTLSVQLAFNQRGTAMWAAFNQDEVIGMVGAGIAAGNSTLLLVSQSTGTSVPVNYTGIHSE